MKKAKRVLALLLCLVLILSAVEMCIRDSIYDEEEQMPVETSGDVLILAYAATVLSGDMSFIAENKDLLLKLGDYLVETGNDIANQKNADDYAKAISGSVNLAVKSCIAPVAYTHLDVYKRQICVYSYQKS